MQQAGVQWIVVTYRQHGQAPLVAAFTDADKLAAQAGEVKARLEKLQPGTAPGSSVPAPRPAPSVPRQIVSVCMGPVASLAPAPPRSEEHTSELQSLMRISYAVFCLKKKQRNQSDIH